MRPPTPPRSVRDVDRGDVADARVEVRPDAGAQTRTEVRPEVRAKAPDGGHAKAPDGGHAEAARSPRRAGRGSRRRGARGRGRGPVRRRPSEPPAVTTRLRERLAERTDARRRRVRRRRLLVVVGGLVAAALAYLLLWSPVLALAPDGARIEGTGDVVDAAAVARVADAETGVPLARIDTGDLETAIERIRGVRSADVSRAWPNGLVVAIEPRVPVAAVPVEGGYVVLDAEGVEVLRAPAAPPGLAVVDIELGQATEVALDAVLTVLGGLPPALLDEVTAAGAESADAVRLVLADRSTVVWGSVESSALKLRVLEVLRQRPASVYDVSAPTMPVTR